MEPPTSPRGFKLASPPETPANRRIVRSDATSVHSSPDSSPILPAATVSSADVSVSWKPMVVDPVVASASSNDEVLVPSLPSDASAPAPRLTHAQRVAQIDPVSCCFKVKRNSAVFLLMPCRDYAVAPVLTYLLTFLFHVGPERGAV
jgi:hypothetical protein